MIIYNNKINIIRYLFLKFFIFVLFIFHFLCILTFFIKNIQLNNFHFSFLFLQYGDWGLGIGDWGLGIGYWAQSPIPNPPSPSPHPQYFLYFFYHIKISFYKNFRKLYLKNIYLYIYKNVSRRFNDRRNRKFDRRKLF